MGVSDKRDIQNVQCWGAPRTRVERHWHKPSSIMPYVNIISWEWKFVIRYSLNNRDYNIDQNNHDYDLCHNQATLLNVPSLLVLKWHFRISNKGLGSAVKLSTWDLNPWRKEIVLYKRGFVGLLFFLYVHTRTAELLYKCNITLVGVWYAVYWHTVITCGNLPTRDFVFVYIFVKSH